MSDQATPEVESAALADSEQINDIQSVSPIQQTYVPPIRLRVPKPDGFDTRQFCEAPTDSGPCQAMREECKKHCGAWARSRGWACPTPPTDAGRCRMHGGKAPRMQSAPRYKGGPGSRYLPRELQKRHAELMASPDLLSVRSEIGTVQLRIEQLTSEITSQSSRELFDDISSTWEKFKIAAAKGDTTNFALLRSKMDAQLKDGATAYSKWNELIQVSKDKAQLARSEIECMVDMHGMVAVERVILMIAHLGNLAQKHVKDKDALKTITDELSSFLGRREAKAAVAAPATQA